MEYIAIALEVALGQDIEKSFAYIVSLAFQAGCVARQQARAMARKPMSILADKRIDRRSACPLGCQELKTLSCNRINQCLKCRVEHTYCLHSRTALRV
ncbi:MULTISPECIES: hypothetical protein [Burkholderiaceae]|uniref:hypothetical protein n=1 Tax=Burkholderiaceae TaxID=119060 RepID=UPI000A3B8345|nr:MULTISPECIES: hypothetical protein [Burkholderiaceae]